MPEALEYGLPTKANRPKGRDAKPPAFGHRAMAAGLPKRQGEHAVSFRSLSACVVPTLLLVAPCVVPLRAGTLSPDLQRAASARGAGQVRVIVETRSPAAPEAGFAVRRGARDVFVFRGFPGFRATLPVGAVPSLSRRPNVKHVSSDQQVAASGWAGVVTYSGPSDYAAKAAGADVVAALPAPVPAPAIAILDTGVAPVPGLRIVGWFDAVSGVPAPYDDGGHGTHVAGIAAGAPARGGAVGGACAGAPIVAVKVLDAAARGTASDVIRGIDWCIEHREALNIGVINLSLGHRVTQAGAADPLCRAVERAVASGIVVVVAAGNQGDGYGGIECPGNSPAAITVGATRTGGTPFRSDDSIASYSSRGPTAFDGLAKPDVLAPGNRVASLRAPGSLLDVCHPENRVAEGGHSLAPPRYFVLSGTSMSAPLVAGIAARIRAVCPAATPNAVKAALMMSAQRLGGWDPVLRRDVAEYDWMTQGAGYVNAPGALLAAVMLTGAADTDAALGEPGRSWIAGESIVWGDTVIWGRCKAQLEASVEVGRDLGCVLWGDGLPDGDGSGGIEDVVAGTSALWRGRPVVIQDRPVLVLGDE